PLRGLGLGRAPGRPSSGDAGGDGGASQLEQVSTADQRGGFRFGHVLPPMGRAALGHLDLRQKLDYRAYDGVRLFVRRHAACALDNPRLRAWNGGGPAFGIDRRDETVAGTPQDERVGRYAVQALGDTAVRDWEQDLAGHRESA